MGRLNIPDGSRIYADTSIFIYTIDKVPDYFTLLYPMWSKYQADKIELMTSELTLTEVLVLPLKNSDSLRINAYEKLILSSKLRPIALDRVILREAARLRSITNIKTPDAIHAATALINNCTIFLTNDRGFNRITGLPVVILSEVLAA
ncbi:MAG: PIN domain-containing protein [Cyanobacteria bacterium P01_E01_bin.42]